MHTAHTLESHLRFRSSRSLNFTNTTPGTRGAKGARYFSCPVVAKAPKVRPWNEFSSARMRHFGLRPLCDADTLVRVLAVPALHAGADRSVRARLPLGLFMRAEARASFNAPSQASVPLLQKKARSSPEIWVSRRASSA